MSTFKSKSRITPVLSALALAISCSASANDDFNTQISLGYSEVPNIDSYGVTGTYFFDSINTERVPLREAVFLDPTSNISLGYFSSDANFGSSLRYSSVELDSWRLAGQFVTADQRFFATLGASRINREAFYNLGVSTFLFDDDDEAYDLSAGMYLMRDWTITANVELSDGLHLDAYGVESKKLFPLTNKRYLSVYGGMSFSRIAPDSYYLGAEYYVTRKLSFAATHSWDNGFADVNEGFLNLSTNWFVTPKFAVTLGPIFEVDSVDLDSFSVGIEGRF